jgi:hypothetical protein
VLNCIKDLSVCAQLEAAGGGLLPGWEWGHEMDGLLLKDTEGEYHDDIVSVDAGAIFCVHRNRLIVVLDASLRF